MRGARAPALQQQRGDGRIARPPPLAPPLPPLWPSSSPDPFLSPRGDDDGGQAFSPRPRPLLSSRLRRSSSVPHRSTLPSSP